MANLQKKGYVEQPVDDADVEVTSRIWYLTHFATRQSKFRVVYDGSAHHRQNALNQHILSGPDLLTPLMHVFAHFCKGAIAFMADIAECFFQVKLLVHQRDFFRVLWVEDGCLSGNIKV